MKVNSHKPFDKKFWISQFWVSLLKLWSFNFENLFLIDFVRIKLEDFVKLNISKKINF